MRKTCRWCDVTVFEQRILHAFSEGFQGRARAQLQPYVNGWAAWSIQPVWFRYKQDGAVQHAYRIGGSISPPGSGRRQVCTESLHVSFLIL